MNKNSQKLNDEILDACPSSFLPVAKLLLDKINSLEEMLLGTKTGLEEVTKTSEKSKK